MQKPSDKIDILSETAVFDYVAGHQSAESRANFERMMERDESLRKAVESERRLRAELSEYEKKSADQEPIPADNIDSLLAQLDDIENSPQMVQNESKERTGSQQPRVSRGNWFGIAGVAASIAFVSVVLIGQQSSQVKSDYELLSNQPITGQDSYSDLVDAKRVAQIWLETELSDSDTLTLFEHHRLEPISRSGAAWIVSSNTSLSAHHLEALEQSEQIRLARLVSFGQEIQTNND